MFIIIFCTNRYRSYKPQVDEGLTIAEKLFYKGEYKNETEDDMKCKSYELNENWLE